jgi:hypothetical protein
VAIPGDECCNPFGILVEGEGVGYFARNHRYDARFKAEDSAEDKKDAELNAYLQSHHRRFQA